MIFAGRNKIQRFKDTDRKIIKDQEHTDDYNSAVQYGRVRLGKLCMYYRDLGVKYCVPYDHIHKAFTRISECPEDEFSNNHEYYRLILVHDDKEFANLIFSEEPLIEKIYEELRLINPDILIGFGK